MNIKLIILVCLLGYISSQALKKVCMYNNFFQHRRLAERGLKERGMQAVTPRCPKNHDSCCNATQLNTVKGDWIRESGDLKRWYKELQTFVSFAVKLLSESNMRIANWKNNTTCKGKNIAPLTRRRLQAVQPKCAVAQELYDAMQAVAKTGVHFKADSDKCLSETLRIGAGAYCQMCDNTTNANVDFQNNKIFVAGATGDIFATGECSRMLESMYRLNPIFNALEKMVPGRRRLQAIKKPTDYIGFDVLGCTSKARRLQAIKPKNFRVSKYRECANLSLWYMNNTLMNNSHDLHLNPAMVAILDRVVQAIGTASAKSEWTTVKNLVSPKRRLQSIAHKKWGFEFNSTFTGLSFSDHTPSNVNFLN